jgi:hypothetical protein
MREKRPERLTIFANKVRGTTYISHGSRNPQGGSFSTADAGWSLKHAIAFETSRIRLGEHYDIEVNGKITETNLVKGG